MSNNSKLLDDLLYRVKRSQHGSGQWTDGADPAVGLFQNLKIQKWHGTTAN